MCTFRLMPDSNLYKSLVGLFIETARAHHQATGGVNPQWAEWYAHRMIDSLREITGSGITEVELRDWLIAADVRYNTEPQSQGWPKAYAEWMSDETSGTSD